MTGAAKLGNEFLVNTTTASSQQSSTVTALADGHFVVAWIDTSATGGDTSDWAIRAQVFNADGSKSGAEFLVNTTTAGLQEFPSITALTNGRFVVAWDDSSQSADDTSGTAIRAQIFNTDGSKSGTEFLVNTATSGYQLGPKITTLSNGAFVVTWTDGSSSGADLSSWAVNAQVFNANGSKSGSEFVVNTTTQNFQYNPEITALTNGHFVVAWTDGSMTGGDTSGSAVRAQVFNADGSKSGAEFLVNTTTAGDQSGPGGNPGTLAIAGLADGRFVVAWGEDGNDTPSTSTAIRAQIFNADGSKSGAEFLVNTATASFQLNPTITGLADGRFVVGWTDGTESDGDTSGTSVRAQVFNADGSKSGTDFLVNTTTTSFQQSPTIAALSNGHFVVTWDDGSQTGGDTSGTAVRAQIFDAKVVSLPPGSDPEITFISGITADAKVAATSFDTWDGAKLPHPNDNKPATYDPTQSFATKWGTTTLSASGTAGGNVLYWFDTGSLWTSAEKAALKSGLQLWSAEVNITFTEATSAPDPNDPNVFTFVRGAPGTGAGTQFASISTIGSGTEGAPIAGPSISIDTSMAKFKIGGAFTEFGGYPYQTLVHEEGHMLGLGHAGPYNAGANLDPSAQQFSVYDTRLWTLMSYIDPSNTSAKYYGSYPVPGTDWGTDPDGHPYGPTTPMILDILAAQRIYGAPTSGPLASGGQIFGFHSNIAGAAGPYFDFTINTHPVITIWDGGTHNTLDLSGWSASATINLNPGTFSSANGETNNIGIAEATTIETAIGGSGGDVIVGSDANNVLDGLAGNDTLTGGPGNDTIDGGSGLDTAIFSGPRSAYSITHVGTSLQVSGPDGLDTLTNVERLAFDDITVPSATPHDFDANFHSDILWQRDDATVAVWDNGQIGGGHWIADPGVVPASWHIADKGDFDGNGHSDILWRNDDGSTSIWDNGAIGSAHIVSGPGVVANSWHISGTGDFDGNGHDDILWRNDDGSASIWDNGAIGSAHIISGPGVVPAGWNIAGTGDFDGNGQSDILWRNDNGAVSIWDNGDINQAHIIAGAGIIPSGWSIAGTGDFDGNGHSDILWHRDDGSVSIWDNGAIGSAHIIANPGVVPSSWHIAGTGDFDGNGHSDILWHNDNGAASIWDNGDINQAHIIANAGVIPSGWHIV